jgi:cytoskeletal protein RodZ
MDPADKFFLAVGGVVLLAIAGVSTWLMLRDKRTDREKAEHERIRKARAQPETPPRRSASTSEATASATTASEATANAAAASEATTSETTVSTSRSAANDGPAKEPPRVIVGNDKSDKKRRHAVPRGAVIELKMPTLGGHCEFQASRTDVGVRLVESGLNRAWISLDGAAGQVNVALVEKVDDSTSGRVVTSWKFDLQAA